MTDARRYGSAIVHTMVEPVVLISKPLSQMHSLERLIITRLPQHDLVAIKTQISTNIALINTIL